MIMRRYIRNSRMRSRLSGTGSAVSDEASLLGDQQFEMYTEYKGDRHEDNLINEERISFTSLKLH